MNWTLIIEELQKAGYSQEKIAKYCNCSQGLISQIKKKYSTDEKRKGKSISYEVGNNLLKLHNNVIKNVTNR